MKFLNCLLALVLFLVCDIAQAKNVIVLFRENSKIATNSEKKSDTDHMISSLVSFSTFGINSFFKLDTAIQPQKVLWAIGGFSADLSEAQQRDLMTSGLVAGIFEDGKKYIYGNPVPSGEQGPYTYGLKNTGVVDLRAEHPEVTGKGVVVGVIDTGVDGDHPDLKGKVVGFKDFVNKKDDKPYDDQGHGTHVSGTIAGGAASGTAIGMAPDAHLIVAKVFTADGSANDSDILSAMQWFLDLDVKPVVVSNSWGGSQPDDHVLDDVPFYKMVDAWVKAGMFPSFAAGNEGNNPSTIAIPGGMTNAFAVGAVDDKNEVAVFSSRGPILWKINGAAEKSFTKPDVCAPGMNVYSSLPGGKYAAYSGTSMATPHVSGMVALIKQVHPEYTVQQLEQALLDTAKALGDANDYGKGLISAKAVGL